jgi:hypothetical protein
LLDVIPITIIRWKYQPKYNIEESPNYRASERQWRRKK